MKIAMIGQKGIPAASGGVERHVEEIAKRLAAGGHDVTVYCRSTYSEQRPDEYEGIRLRYVKTLYHKNLEAIVYAFQASCMALFKDYDIIHYHALGPASMSFIPRLANKNVVVTLHGLDWQREKWGKLAKAYLKLGEKASAMFPAKIISVSENLQKYYINKYKKTRDEVIFIPNGVRVNLSPAPPREILKFGLKGMDYILFLARLVPEKGAHYLIEAYRRIKTDKKLVIAGGSSYTDGYVEEIKEKAGNLSDVILTGAVQGRLLEELYSNAYLYVLPSDVEGMPITLLEAMSYARCCVTSDIPENTAVIKDRFGFSFRRGDIQDLSAKLEFLSKNPDVVQNIGESARREIEKNYDWDAIADKTVKVYESIFR